ncbi:ATP-dependent Clp protease proteolytic subunit [Apiospora arundinis]
MRTNRHLWQEGKKRPYRKESENGDDANDRTILNGTAVPAWLLSKCGSGYATEQTEEIVAHLKSEMDQNRLTPLRQTRKRSRILSVRKIKVVVEMSTKSLWEYMILLFASSPRASSKHLLITTGLSRRPRGPLAAGSCTNSHQPSQPWLADGNSPYGQNLGRREGEIRLSPAPKYELEDLLKHLEVMLSHPTLEAVDIYGHPQGCRNLHDAADPFGQIQHRQFLVEWRHRQLGYWKMSISRGGCCCITDSSEYQRTRKQDQQSLCWCAYFAPLFAPGAPVNDVPSNPQFTNDMVTMTSDETLCISVYSSPEYKDSVKNPLILSHAGRQEREEKEEKEDENPSPMGFLIFENLGGSKRDTKKSRTSLEALLGSSSNRDMLDGIWEDLGSTAAIHEDKSTGRRHEGQEMGHPRLLLDHRCLDQVRDEGAVQEAIISREQLNEIFRKHRNQGHGHEKYGLKDVEDMMDHDPIPE